MAKERFDDFYRTLYGERWEGLRESLLEEPRLIPFDHGLTAPYFLDPASVRAAEALGVRQDDLVLDLCAAPGGKTLVLSSTLGPSGELVANDRSSGRRARLHRVLDDHLTPEARSRVRVTPHDASRWGLHEQNRYDRVLVDVPCSSERHVLTSPAHLARWSPARTRHLAIQAYAILAAGFAALRPGGTLVYATCTISPFENDRVIEKLLKKQGEQVLLMPIELDVGEATDRGWIILPDRAGGLGPMFICRLSKRERDGLHSTTKSVL